jgi:hypothetical protein
MEIYGLGNRRERAYHETEIMRRMMTDFALVLIPPDRAPPDGPTVPTREQWKEILDCSFTATLESKESRTVAFIMAFFGE